MRHKNAAHERRARNPTQASIFQSFILREKFMFHAIQSHVRLVADATEKNKPLNLNMIYFHVPEKSVV